MYTGLHAWFSSLCYLDSFFTSYDSVVRQNVRELQHSHEMPFVGLHVAFHPELHDPRDSHCFKYDSESPWQLRFSALSSADSLELYPRYPATDPRDSQNSAILFPFDPSAATDMFSHSVQDDVAENVNELHDFVTAHFLKHCSREPPFAITCNGTLFEPKRTGLIS